jgi:hypothetical protein
MLKRLLIAVIVLAPVSAHAVDGDRYLTLGKCMAYAAVKGGLDGKKPIPPDYAQVIQLLGDEYMFEARTLGFTELQAQVAFATELVRQNKIKAEKGLPVLTDELGKLCSDLADEFKSANSSKNGL